MDKIDLKGMRILVVEDEYLLADDLRGALMGSGAEVLGPVPSVEQAAELLGREQAINAALLDVNLRGEMVFKIADALSERGIPYAFVTGYDRSAIPDRYAKSASSKNRWSPGRSPSLPRASDVSARYQTVWSRAKAGEDAPAPTRPVPWHRDRAARTGLEEGGVRALIGSHGSFPRHRKRCGLVL